jgi:hypothetical protein
MRTVLRRLIFASLGFAVGLCPVRNASASLIATATFTTPAGTVNAMDSIPVFLTLSLDPSSDPLITDGSGNLISSYSIADVQANLFSGLPDGVDPTVDPLHSYLNEFFECSGTFTTSCTQGPPYDFQFGPPISFNLDLEPGNSIDLLLGTFTPTGGIAPPGTYTFLNGGVFIQIFDDAFPVDPSDPSSLPGLHIADIPVAAADTGGSVFTRDVIAGAPEPGSGLLLLAGFAFVGGLFRRKLNLEVR